MFGSKETVDAEAEHDKAVLALKTQRDQLKKFMKRVNMQLEKEVEMAKRLMAEGKKDKARYCLRKKRMQQNLIQQAEQNLQNIEEMINTIEFAQIQQKVMDNLKKGNEALKKLQSMSVEEVEDILLDTKEALEYQQEVDRLMSESLTQEDDAEILKELEALTFVEKGPEIQFPEVPTHEPIITPTPTTQPEHQEPLHA
uniref:Charged multivesicular body protein 6 n=1 Tax=Arcella intermedia TaxID=1963864 RepID=A0A6B2LJW0_9EUKA